MTTPSSSLASSAEKDSSQSSSEVLIRAEHVSKIFCRDLKKSLAYGVSDVLGEFISSPPSPEALVAPPKEDGKDLRSGEFWATRDVSFELRRGECLGLIGHNGAGKTTLLKMLNGLIKPDRGRITMKGRVGALIALNAGFNPILTGRENIYINGSVLGLKKKEIDAKFDKIVEFAELADFIDTPVQSYSSGMQVRLGFSVATALKPDILLIDEVLAVGDMKFREKCLTRINEILPFTAVIFVSHNMQVMQRICDFGLVLEAGKKIDEGNIDTCIQSFTQRQLEDSKKKGSGQNSIKNLHENVREVEAQLISATDLKWGERLEFKVKLQTTTTIKPDTFVVLVAAAGSIPVAHSALKVEACPTGSKGLEAKLILDDLYLASGHYHVHVVICGDSGKTTYCRYMNCLDFYMTSTFFGNCNYQPKISYSSTPLETSR